jgi:subtilisin family serine protease
MKNFPQQLPHSSGVPMFLDVRRLLLAFQHTISNDDLMRFLKESDLFLEDNITEHAIPGERVNHTDQRFWVYSRRPIDEERYRKIEESAQKLGLEFISPVYSLAHEPGSSTAVAPGSRRNLLAPLPNVILIKPNEQTGPSETADFAAAAAVNGREPAIKEIPEKTRFLNGYHYYLINNSKDINAYEIKRQLLESHRPLVLDLQFESMPLLVPAAAIIEPQAGPVAGGAPAVAPNDPLFPQQWDMVRIQAGGPGTTGWDISTGVSTVVTCVLDEGCDLTHPDLQARYSTTGINLGTMMPDGSPTGNHGTACAGIVAATYANSIGVSGVAGNSSLMPVAFQNWTDVEVANGLNWATTNGARIISMSFGWDAWSHAIIDPAIQNAFNNNVVMCVATHNYNGSITYPATNPLVIAVGASDEIDNRKSPSSPDGEGWGSDFGPEISVVAPGVHIPTTDRQGADGYNSSSGTAGDYFLTFNGTSSATPHVAGMAALILSVYPTLTNVQIRNIIEKTAEKVGVVPYADVPGYPNGTWNQEMGYGRINVLRALDFADVMIKDAASDTGTEPFTGSDFWDFSDIVVRITDDNVFVPSDPAQSKNVERGQANYIYVRVTNNGPKEARNVTVGARIIPYVGLQFVYPQDWNLVDAMHVSPTPLVASFASVPAGGTVMAKFRIEAAQTDTLYGWEFSNPWHPCLLAVVNADNDYAFATAPLTGDPISARRNNLAQRNLSVIDVLSSAAVAFPFIMGSRYKTDRKVCLRIDRSRLPKDMPLLLSLDDEGKAFPLVDFAEVPTNPYEEMADGCSENHIVFLERTRIKTQLGCCDGVLTLEKGSRFDGTKPNRLGKVTVQGGDVLLRGDKRYVDIKDPVVVVEMEKEPNRIYPLSLQTVIPAAFENGHPLMIDVAQQNSQGETVGGAGVIYQIKK